MKILNVKRFGLHESLKAAGYPMRSKMIYEGLVDEELTEKDELRGERLGNTPNGSGHGNFLKGVIYQFDIIYTQYVARQLQRYKFLDIVSSMSMIHRLHTMDIDEFTNKYVSEATKDNVKFYQEIYNAMIQYKSDDAQLYYGISGYPEMAEVFFKDEEGQRNCVFIKQEISNLLDDLYVCTIAPEEVNKSEAITKRCENRKTVLCNCTEIYHMLVSNAPMGLTLGMRVTTNLAQLKTIYYQRKNHKLEDWQEFCKWIESLPEFKYFNNIKDEQ